MNYIKKILSIIISLIVVASICLVGMTGASASGTGAGLAEWALNAYYEGWEYVYGGSTPGSVDCSGLIYSYCGGDRVGSAQLYNATESGSVSSGIPRVHGLGLFQPGHVGVYVGNGMAVDARGDAWDMCYQSTATKAWTQWFKLRAVSYPEEGWVKFNGDYYYYQDGEYVVSCTLTIDGEDYKFGSNGVSNTTPSDMSGIANGNSNQNSDKNDNKKETTAPTTQATTAAPSVLKNGSSGDKVIKLQERLTELGFYSDAITGYFGDATESAYRAFQTAAGVTVDGIAGESDLDILYSDRAPIASTTEETEPEEETEPIEEEPKEVDDGIYTVGEQGDVIVDIQYQLNSLGYFYESPTGYFGDITAEAVRTFQEVHGLKVTGKVNKKTYDLLFSGNAVENPYYEEPTEPETESVNEEISIGNTTEVENLTNNMVEIAASNIEAAHKIVAQSNEVTNKALSSLTAKEQTVVLPTEENNQNFLLLMLLVLGVVTVIIGITFTANREKKEYAHAKTKIKIENIRYW